MFLFCNWLRFGEFLEFYWGSTTWIYMCIGRPRGPYDVFCKDCNSFCFVLYWLMFQVQAVLLLLGGYEVPTGIPTPGMTPPNHRVWASWCNLQELKFLNSVSELSFVCSLKQNLGDYPGRSSQPQRAASLNRFREKRKERCFEKKIRYTVRKEVALRL